MSMLKKLSIAGTGLAMVVIGTAYVYRADIGLAVMTILIVPGHGFDDVAPPSPPDYDNPDHWAALPDREDLADAVPPGGTDQQADARVDVFFVHPTTYVTADGWNQPLDHGATNQLTDEMVMQGQASAFNACCRIFAPRYRQATLAAFFDEEGHGTRALDLAYQDVLAAFHYYLDELNEGRPFIIAAHSQGSRHVDLLLAEQVVGTPLAEQLVAAYPVGFEINGSNGLPVCAAPTQTGCQVTWNSVGPRAGPLFASPDNVCVNPLTWATDGAAAAHDLNLGAVNFDGDASYEQGAADAQCVADGRLLVSEIRSTRYAQRPLGRDNYHVYDYALFYVNIRQNAQARVEAFLASR
tara:strand:- start:36 stop:1094 length:1059 start_codon:yes stop_codon:yes gene_type:complete